MDYNKDDIFAKCLSVIGVISLCIKTQHILHWFIEILPFNFPSLDFCLAVSQNLFCHDSWLLWKINTAYVRCTQFLQCLIYEIHTVLALLFFFFLLAVPLHQKRQRTQRQLPSWYFPGRGKFKSLRVQQREMTTRESPLAIPRQVPVDTEN